ncbi:MAG: hypothetical protein IIA17_06020 [candidate division Zixibacteria bacterium]|nr:hypothetical protein [candidate division Zixibacteria bacterium]
MNYGKIVEDSFSLGWKYKSLWFFGLFAGSFGEYNFQYEADEPFDFETLEYDSYQGVLEYLAPILAAILVMVFVLSILRLICSPALVDGVNKITRGGTYEFWSSYSRALDFFWRYLGLNVLFVAVMTGVIIVTFGIAVMIHWLMIFLMFPVIMIFGFVGSSVFGLAERSLVVRDNSIGDALEEGWVLFKNNIGKCIVIVLIIFGLALAVGIVLALMGFMLYFPINLLVGGITENIALTFVLAFILGLPVSIVLGGFAGTFFHSLYTLFYFGLVDPSTPYAAQSPAAPAPTLTQP